MRGLTPPRRRLGRLSGPLACLVPLACVVGLSGCYTFARAAPDALPAGARVRVALTDVGAAALAPTVGQGVGGIEGELVRQSGDTLVVHADKLLTSAGVDVAWSGGSLAVPPAWQRTVDRRRLATGRTTLLVAGGVALSAGVIALVRSLGDDGGGDGGGGGPIVFSRGRP